MTVRLFLLLSLSALLYGCASEEVKEEQPVEVEDLSSSSADAEGEDAGGVQAYGTDDSASSSFSELDDPASTLAMRTIFFEYDSSEIRADFRHIAWLRANPE